MSWPAAAYLDGDAGTAKRCSLPIKSCPIPGQNAQYLLTEDWMQYLASGAFWTPTALNTAHGEDSDFKLVEETQPRDMGGGFVRWTKVFAKVPSTHSEWETYGYRFIGLQGYVATEAGTTLTSITGREPYTYPVVSRVQHDYFLVGSGLTYEDPGEIPEIAPFYYLGYTPFSIRIPATYLATYTLPSLTNYLAMVKDAVVNGWSASVAAQPLLATTDHETEVNTASCTYTGQIVAEPSRLSRWRGNIYLRQTRYVLAQ